MVRQGPRRGPKRRHPPPRELRGHRAPWRRARARGRRSPGEVVDPADALRGRVLRLPHAGAVSRERPGHPRPGPPGVRAVALLGALGGLQGGDRRRRRGRHRRGAPRPGRDRGSGIHLRGPSLGGPPAARTPAALHARRGARDRVRAPRSGPSLCRGQRPEPDHGPDAGRVARDRVGGQGVLRPSPGAGRPLARRRGPPAPRDPAPQARHALPARAGDRPGVRAGARRDPRRRGEAGLPRAAPPRGALRAPGPAPHRRQARRRRPGAGAGRRRAGCRRGRPRRRPPPRAAGLARLGPRPGGGDRGGARAAGVAHPGPPAVLLLGVPPQPLDRRARGVHGRGRDRVPRPRHEHGPERVRDHPDGGRGGPVGGSRAVRRRAAPLPAARGWDVLPFRVARDPPGGGRGHQRHLQDPLQLGRRDDGRPGRGGRGAGAGPHAPAGCRGRAADPGADRRAWQVPAGRALGAGRGGLEPGPSRRGPADPSRGPGRDGARVRPALRGGEAAAPEARASSPIRRSAS